MPRINAGKYRHRITIKARPGDSSRDTYGRRRKSPASTVDTVWAEKQDWSGSEVDELGRETPIVIVKWRTRYRSDITPAMVIEYGDVEYEILSALDFDGMQRELVIESRKVVQ